MNDLFRKDSEGSFPPRSEVAQGPYCPMRLVEFSTMFTTFSLKILFELFLVSRVLFGGTIPLASPTPEKPAHFKKSLRLDFICFEVITKFNLFGSDGEN